MKRPPESLKSFANRVGDVAVLEDASEAVRLLHLAGFLQRSTKHNFNSSTDDNFSEPNSDHVGIWGRKIENGKSCFIRRPETSSEWALWANVARIEAKGAKRRVVLIGESVARGYFYDPQFTPALALQAMLDAQFSDEFEVIDLARTNLSYKVRELALEALQLDPDLVIIFAGNNWCVAEPGASDLAEIAEALSSGGVATAKRTTEAQLERNARSVVKDVSRAYENKGIPVVWIIPEYNLADWREPVTNAPYLSASLNQQWLILLEEAHNAFAYRDFAKAENLARQMLEIDHGVCTAALFIVAECRKASNDLQGARKYLELVKDSSCWDLSRAAVPKPYSVTQRVMREEIPKYRNQLVDLPALCKDYLNGEIPDRRLFLDYCHLTSEGIQLAMANAASCVLRTLKGVDVTSQSLIGEHTAPSRETEAEALFLAAIMNAHWAPSRDVMRYLCARALNYSGHIAGVMLNFLELQSCAVVPMLMGEADQQIYKLGSPLIHHYLLRLNEKRLDALLLDVIVDALADVGIDAGQPLDQFRREEHSVTVRETNLLDHYYCSAVNQPQEIAWQLRTEDKRYRPDAQYYKAYGPESKFIFVGETDCPVALRLTCRLPAPTSLQATISVAINGEPAAEIATGNDWTTWDLTIDGEIVRDGLNEITVRWPIPELYSDKALRKAVMNMYEGKFPGFYPVFGEIHSFTAGEGKVSSLEEVSTTCGSGWIKA